MASTYRKQMLRIAKLLSKEDVDEMVYLAEDFVPRSEARQISSGVDLMRCLEHHGRLGCGRYHYLLDCLKAIGRLDLATSLTDSIIPVSREFVKPHFGFLDQMYGMKLGVLQSKWKRYTQYLKQMTTLAEDTCFWEQEWRTMFENLCMFLSSGHTTSAKSALQTVLGATLNDTSKATVAWTTAVADFDKYRKHH